MSGLAGLGAIAGGAARGIERGQDMAYRAEEMEQRRKLRAREESEREALDYANKQATDFFRQATTPMPREQTGLTLDEGAMGPLTGVQPEQKPQMSEQDAIYGAMQRRTAALAERGATKPWLDSWKQTADLRAHMREQKYNEAEAEYRQTGDATVFAKKVYPFIEDGYDLVDAFKGTGLDKKPVMHIVRRNKASGKEETQTMSPDEYIAGVRFAIDPKGVRALEAKYALEDYKSARKIAEQEAKGDVDAEVEGVRQRGRLELEERRTAGDLRVEGARTAGNIKEEGVKQTNRLALEDKKDGGGDSPGGGGGSRKLQSTKVDEDGYMVGVFKDGSSRRLTDEKGKPIRAESMAKRIDTLAENLAKNSSRFRRMEPDERRKEAERMLLNGEDAPSGGSLADKAPAAAPAPAAPKMKVPQRGATDGGYVFLGGDPSKSENWKKVR